MSFYCPIILPDVSLDEENKDNICGTKEKIINHYKETLIEDMIEHFIPEELNISEFDMLNDIIDFIKNYRSEDNETDG